MDNGLNYVEETNDRPLSFNQKKRKHDFANQELLLLLLLNSLLLHVF